MSSEYGSFSITLNWLLAIYAIMMLSSSDLLIFSNRDTSCSLSLPCVETVANQMQ